MTRRRSSRPWLTPWRPIPTQTSDLNVSVVCTDLRSQSDTDRQTTDILAPLTSVTDLPTHPTLSRPFTSKALSELVIQGRDLMQKENAALWRAKPLLTKLVGDNTWAPCGLMTAPDDQDALLFTDTTSFFTNRLRQSAADAAAAPKMNGDNTTNAANATEGAKQETTHAQPEAQTQKPDVEMDGTQKKEQSKEPNADGEAPRDEHPENNNVEGAPSANADKPNGDRADDKTEKAGQQADGEPKPANTASADVKMTDAPAPNALEQANASAPSAPQQEQSPQPNAPRANNTDVVPNGLPNPFDDDEDPFIHPLFRLPPQAHPDRNFFLPEQEANEVRRLLLLYVQKQEEICRGARRLYEGLLRAERLRKTVWQWSKAEAHCGANRDMSDGEDWYDKEEWGLTEDLKKGEDEVEEDTQVVTKKTRNRK